MKKSKNSFEEGLKKEIQELIEMHILLDKARSRIISFLPPEFLPQKYEVYFKEKNDLIKQFNKEIYILLISLCDTLSLYEKTIKNLEKNNSKVIAKEIKSFKNYVEYKILFSSEICQIISKFSAKFIVLREKYGLNNNVKFKNTQEEIHVIFNSLAHNL